MIRTLARLVVASVVLVVVSSAFAPAVEGTPGTALGCDACKDSGNQHIFGEGGAMMSCTACNSCHTNWQTGWCLDFHCACGVSFKDARDNIDVIASAVEASDVSEIRSAMKRFGPAVKYNEARGAVQVYGCYRDVIAHFPVQGAVAEALD